MDFQTVLKTFSLHADPAKAAPMKAYMRHQFEFLGIPTPIRREISKPLLAELRREPAIDWDLVQRCYSAAFRELHYFALGVLSAQRKRLMSADLPRLEALIRQNSWWDTVDSIDELAGYLVQQDPELKAEMLRWSTDGDFWVRRAAIDHQLGFRKRTDTGLLAQTILNNLGSKEFFINKAIGWSLREYAKTDPDWVRAFVLQHHAELAPLSIREATKHLKLT